MSLRWRRMLYLVGLALGLLLFLQQIWYGYQAIRSNTLHLAAPLLLVAAWGVVAIAIGLQMAAWAVLMRVLDIPLSWQTVVASYTLSFLPRYIPGSIWGYISRGEWLRQQHQVPYAVSSFGSVLEVFVALLTGVVVLAIHYASKLMGAPSIILLVGIVVALWLIWKTLHWVPRQGWLKRLGGSPFGISLLNWLTVLFVYMLLWLCYGLMVMFVSQAFGFTGNLDLLESTFMFSLSWLTGFIVVFVPSGLGVREIALSTLLATRTGLNYEHASLISIMLRFCVLLAEASWAICGFLMTRLSGRRMMRPDNEDNPN